LNADVDLNGGPTINGSAVYCGYLGWLAGYQMSFDMSKSQLTRNNLSFAYVAKEYALHSYTYDYYWIDNFSQRRHFTIIGYFFTVTMDKNLEEPCTRKSIQILKLLSSLVIPNIPPPDPIPPDSVLVASTS
jgi:hypothetical protein